MDAAKFNFTIILEALDQQISKKKVNLLKTLPMEDKFEDELYVCMTSLRYGLIYHRQDFYN